MKFSVSKKLEQNTSTDDSDGNNSDLDSALLKGSLCCPVHHNRYVIYKELDEL